MASYKILEDLPIWKSAKDIAIEVYQITAKSDFKRDYSLVDQMRRSAVSVSSNIAEGYERGTKKEFIYFLYIAKGSLGELRSQFIIAFELNYVSYEIFQNFNEKCLNLSRRIQGFIKYLKLYKGTK